MENCKLKAILKTFGYSIPSLRTLINNLNVKARYNRMSSYSIRGPGIAVEIDESKFGIRKYHRGHRVDGVWVLGLVERTPERKIIFMPVKDRTKETLTTLIHRFVQQGSIVYTDCWKGYIDVHKCFEHHTVNHSIVFIDPVSGVHTNTIEENWSPLKKFIPNSSKTEEKFWLLLLLSIYKRNGGIKG